MEKPHLRISENSVSKTKTNFNGGGSTYQRSDYRAHGQELLEDLLRISQQSYDIDPVKDRKFFEVNLAPGEKLYDRFGNLMEKSDIEVLDVINDSYGYGVISNSSLNTLQRKVENYINTPNNKGKSYYSFIDDIGEINPLNKISQTVKSKIDFGEKENLKVSIESFTSLPKDVAEKGFKEAIEKFIENRGGFITDQFLFSSGSVLVEGTMSSEHIEDLVRSFSSIKSVDVQTKVSITTLTELSQVVEEITVETYDGNAVVCVIDSGVDSSNSFLSPYITEQIDYTPAYSYDRFHGTFVAGRVIFRDKLDEQISRGTLTPFCRVLDFNIYGKDGNGEELNLSEIDLIRAIRKVVQAHKDEVKVYNLSINLISQNGYSTLDEFKVTRLAAEIDHISKVYEVLFVISAGNIENVYEKLNNENYPDHFIQDSQRINSPAESYLSLSVGSLIKNFEDGMLGGENHPAPFSRRGPGFNGSRKPDLVVDGGNLGLNNSDNPSFGTLGFCSYSGGFQRSLGTSFSAPIVSSYAAELFEKIPDATPNLIKGLLIHFANHPTSSEFSRPLEDHLGFGEPNLGKCLESLNSKATYVHEGVIEGQTYYKIPFWIPTILTDETIQRSGNKKVNLRVTVVWDPLTDRGKGLDYSKIHLYSNIYKLNKEDEIKLSLNDMNEVSFKERFYPVTRMEKALSRNIDSGMWSLELRMSKKWGVPEGYAQSFAAIISVEDPYDELDVYSEIENEVGINMYQPIIRI
ncbi:S8 family peptidase [Bacillus altitudinis]|uniref:S8 family peptidase n=1 Tax=Bacillus altitudinis TaxID=293387 RepID=UPI001FB82E9F|nr:S8 family peptidase [Bacillus altitudinis]UOG08274.1 S8 family peptidase [Bacillus altitudinis]